MSFYPYTWLFSWICCSRPSAGMSFKSYLVQYVRETTAIGYEKIVRRLGNLENLADTEAIKVLICSSTVTEGRKELMTNAYDHYCRYKGVCWIKPRFTREDKSESKIVSVTSVLKCRTIRVPMLMGLVDLLVV